MQWLSAISNDRWVDIIGHASLLAAAGFGLLALLTDYKKEGKVTRWGKIAAGGIVLSTVLSIASGTIQDRIQAKAAEDAGTQRLRDDQRFLSQIGELRRLNAEVIGVNRRSSMLLVQMRGSLEGQARLLASQGILLSRAEQARQRDLRLARDVYEGAAANLSRTGVALGQLERVLQPIGPFQAQVVWELPGDDPAVAAATARLAELARRVRADPAVASGLRGVHLGDRNLSIGVFSEFYPTADRDSVLAGATRSPRANVSIFAEGSSAADGVLAISRAPMSSFSPLVSLGDLRFTLSAPERSTLFYNIDTGNLRFEAKLPGDPLIVRTGTVVSIPDLEQGMLAIDRADGTRPGAGLGGQIRALRALMRPVLVRIRAAGRTYDIDLARMRTVHTATGSPVFVANPIRDPNRQ